MKPKSITCDFEIAFINACRAVFNDTPIYCCYFHFNQSMIRKIQNIGLTEDYIINENLRRFLKLPKVLGFIPPDHVEESFLKIRKLVTDDRVLNTDGILICDQSNITIWPIIFVCNEIPIERRFCLDNIVIAG